MPTSVPKALRKDWRSEIVSGNPSWDQAAVEDAVEAKALSFLAGEQHLYWGQSWVHQALQIGSRALHLRVPAVAFAQGNTAGASVLYESVARLVASLCNGGVHGAPEGSLAVFPGPPIVWDLYCGGGALALAVAPFAREVHGIDISRDSISSARVAAVENCVENVSFHVANLGRIQLAAASDSAAVSPRHTLRLPGPDLVLVNPPRGGLSNEVIQALLYSLVPKALVYVSCNPASLARDLATLTGRGGSAGDSSGTRGPQVDGIARAAGVEDDEHEGRDGEREAIARADEARPSQGSRREPDPPLVNASLESLEDAKGPGHGESRCRRPGGASRYRVVRIQPVDMFPQTVHVETVVLLVRDDGDERLSS